ncbi:hypothetical protein [Amycolatopsis anabasis]|uniref:hypothetical protein n=1 Tax=Amycolatopsis anabasis TaxID=1840409 RepID=UPI00131AD92B|nr:hypothetical protein [Amycolatopsis anabasis]
MVFIINGHWVHGHSGGGPGISTNVDWFPGTGWTAVILGNYDGIKTVEPILFLARKLITER